MDIFYRKENQIMRSTGMVRPVDSLGRIVIPQEIRNTYDIQAKDSLEIFTDGEKIILRKYAPSCIFCGNADDTEIYCGKKVCKDCLEKLKHLGE